MEGIILGNVQFDSNLHIPNCILIFKYYSEKTTDLSQVTDNFFLYQVHLATNGVRPHNVSAYRH
jgi:hypothetical protein